MKKFNKVSVAVLCLAFIFGLAGSNVSLAAGPAPVDLLQTSNFVILSKTGITNTGSHTSVITGNVGSSPITAAAMDNVFCSEITGTIYGVDATYTGSGNQACFAGNPPLANKTLVDNAILDMGTAYADAAGRTIPTATELGAGNIGGMTLAPGLYKWSTSVTIPTDITLSGGVNDVWIFQIAGDLGIASGGDIPSGVKVVLAGGAKASNVFWQVGGLTGATLGTYSTFNGNILSAKQVIIQTGAVLVGRALADTQVTLDANVISLPPAPATLHIIKHVINDNGGSRVAGNFTINVAGTNVSSSSFAGSETGVDVTLDAGSYAVTEPVVLADYLESGSGDCSGTIAAGETKTCTITNNDIVQVSGGRGSGSDGSGYRYAPVPPYVDMVTIPSPLVLPDGPGTVRYTYTLRNIGTVSVSSVTVLGDICSPITLISGDINADARLDVNETWVYTCSTVLTKTRTNTVTVTGWANGVSATDIANSTVIVGLPIVPPLIHVTTIPSPLVLSAGGGVVTYTEKVTNPGIVAISNIRLTNDNCGPVNYISGDINGNGNLDTTETWTYTCRMNLVKTITNTVTASGQVNGLVSKDFAITTVVVADSGLPNNKELPVTSQFGQQVLTIAVSLGQGSRGNNVTILQQFLISQGKGSAAQSLAKIGATSYFGSLTRAALAEFQAKVGIIPALGNFGPITRAYLKTNY